MTITVGQATKLNKSNRAAQDAVLGTAVRNLQLAASGSATIIAASGSYAAVADDASNAKIAVATGLTNVKGYIGAVRRSGSPLYNMNVYAGSVAGTLCVKKDPAITGSSIAADDVFTWIAF